MQWLKRAMTIMLAVVATLALTTNGALAYSNYGPYSQINCNHPNTLFTVTCGTIPSHSSDHWIQSTLDCQGAGTTYYQVVDAGNGHVVDSGSCSFYGSTSWKYTVGLYGNYNVKIWGSFGVATIRNCTSSCTVHSL